jgi:hypothetical protein
MTRLEFAAKLRDPAVNAPIMLVTSSPNPAIFLPRGRIRHR